MGAIFTRPEERAEVELVEPSEVRLDRFAVLFEETVEASDSPRDALRECSAHAEMSAPSRVSSSTSGTWTSRRYWLSPSISFTAKARLPSEAAIRARTSIDTGMVKCSPPKSNSNGAGCSVDASASTADRLNVMVDGSFQWATGPRGGTELGWGWDPSLGQPHPSDQPLAASPRWMYAFTPSPSG